MALALAVEPSSWDGLLGGAGWTDIYFRRAYLEAAAIAQSGRCEYLLLRDRGGAVAFPCIVRESTELGVRDVTTVAYGGPLALGQSPPVEQFSSAYERWCAEHDIVTSFVRFHPLLANHRNAPTCLRLERAEGSVAWPLEGDLLAGVHRHHRRLIRRATAAGLRVSATVGPEHLDSFAALYDQTMRRLNAVSFYFFPQAYWNRLSGSLRDDVVLFEALLEDEPVASILCLASRPWLHYHLGANSDTGRNLGANHLLLFSAARFAQKHDYELLHLGSGVGAGGGSLLEFKRRFTSARLREQWLGKGVHDVERYLDLTGTTEIRYEGFFPAYRRAVRDAVSVEPVVRAAQRDEGRSDD
jgi:Acetyltransferase (GNAT) domain